MFTFSFMQEIFMRLPVMLVSNENVVNFIYVSSQSMYVVCSQNHLSLTCLFTTVSF